MENQMPALTKDNRKQISDSSQQTMGNQGPAPAKDGENQSVDGSVMSSMMDTAINSLPIEMHIPGYRFCGPGTHLADRLKRGDTPINRLDCACREHDIAYDTHLDLAHRTVADEKLRQEAKKILKSREASFKERITAWLVAKTMKLKVKMAQRAGGTNKEGGISEIDGGKGIDSQKGMDDGKGMDGGKGIDSAKGMHDEKGIDTLRDLPGNMIEQR